MSVFKEIAAAIAGVWALLLVCDACFGVGEPRFNDDYYLASFYAPRQDNEPRVATTTTPAARVARAFSQFTPGEIKPAKRYSALPTIIR